MRFFTLFVILFCSARAIAQTDSVALSQEYYTQGMEVFGFAHRKQAAELFILATQVNPRNAKAQLMAGESIMLSVQKEKSLDYFRRAWKLDPNVDADILYYLGQAYHYSEKFDSAILFYDRYNRILSRTLNYDKSKKINEVNRKMFECRNAIVYMEHPVDVSIQNLNYDVNSEYPDYAPTIDENEKLMVFTSRRPADNSNDRVAVDHEYYEEIFISEKVNGIWGPARNPGPPLNTGYHNASVNLAPDGSEIIIYHDTGGGDLLLSKKNKDGSWANPVPMEGINTEYLESSATITQDDKTIYFTSNRPGGYGGTDIYSCELGKGGRWTNIKNLGPLVNTELDEEGVFISANGQHLYFSSNGLAGMGDLDIYRSTYDATKKEWGEPLNLGFPINSVENDIYFTLTADEKYAYISSLRRDNLGEQDIYRVDMQRWKPVYLNQPEYADVFADAPVAGAKNPVVSATPAGPGTAGAVETTNEIVSEKKVIEVPPVVSTPIAPPRYKKAQVTFNITDEHNNPVKHEVQVSNTSDSTVSYHIVVAAPVAEAHPFPTNPQVNVGYVMNVYFAHNGIDPISYEGIRNLLVMMKNSPTMRVEISGHTDSKGDANYNQTLSLRRAQAVRNILTKGGADGTRITAVGYGQTNPMETNDTMEGRRLNRRIEFRILEP
jgi:outer membrane protein OmpA-like peptidoglycan-associated protein